MSLAPYPGLCVSYFSCLGCSLYLTLLLSLKQTRESHPVILNSLPPRVPLPGIPQHFSLLSAPPGAPGGHSELESSAGNKLGSIKPSSSLQPDLGAQRGQGQVLAVLHYRHGWWHEHLGCEGEGCPTPASQQAPRGPSSPVLPGSHPGCLMLHSCRRALPWNKVGG